jgi:GNAT superfamily N-acetyltransferase
VEIRLLTGDDAAALWRLRLTALETEPQAFLEPAEHHRNTPVTVYADRLRSGGSDSVVFGAFDGSQLIGMAGFHREQKDVRLGRIWGVFVLSDRRTGGVGRALMDAAIKHAKSLEGLERVHLEVAEMQTAARNLYLGCGFRSIGPGPHGGEEMLFALD